MAILGFIIALVLFKHYMRHLRRQARELGDQRESPNWCDWHEDWHKKGRREWERTRRRAERDARRWARRYGYPTPESAPPQPKAATAEEQIQRRARRRAAAEVGFYAHLQSYLGVIAFLALINALTSWYPWFLWPALGWGFGLFFHYMGVFGARRLKEQYFEPAVAREVQ